MNNTKLKEILCSLFLLSSSVILHASIIDVNDNPSLQIFQSNASGIYNKGNKVEIKIISRNKNTDSVKVKVIKDFSQKSNQYSFKYNGDTLTIFSKVIKQPTTLVFEASDGNSKVSIGSIIGKDDFKPASKIPKDFYSFWANKKKELNSLPFKVQEVKMDEIIPGYTLSDIEINCKTKNPVRGYLAMPSSVKPHSLPIVIYCHAAGVAGSWCKCDPYMALDYAKMGNGAICFDLNAHGMLNNQSDEYYEDLENNELKDYPHIGIDNRDHYYFEGMYMRLLRTINYLTLMKEWDGKRILVIGESQGGGQALVAAGLDPRVTAVVATVPAMCDWGASCKGRSGGWPFNYLNKDEKKYLDTTLTYFDAANIIANSNAKFVVEIGLIDFTCPSSALHAALNGVKGKKIIFDVPYRAHHLEQTQYQEEYNKTVYDAKMKFINDYLK